MTKPKPREDFILTTVNSGAETDHPDLSSDNVRHVVEYVRATYPNYTSYLITVVRCNITLS